ncbi:MAG: hypothetical protein ACRDI0_13410 [Actinomycetota bacterium]
MDLLNTVVSAAVVAVVGLLLSLQLRGEGRARRREVDLLRGEMGQLRGDLRELRAEVAALRTDLTRVALAVGTRPATGTEPG